MKQERKGIPADAGDEGEERNDAPRRTGEGAESAYELMKLQNERKARQREAEERRIEPAGK